MRNSKRFALSTAAALLVLSLIVWVYYFSANTRHIYNLIECSQGEYRVPFVPRTLCRTILLHFRGSGDDVATINQDGSLVAILSPTSNEDQTELLVFLLERGVDINHLDERTGMSPLHTAVLNNNLEVVKLLLRHGANGSVRDKKHGLTALEFAQHLSGKPDEPDRTAIIGLLENSARG